MLRIDPRNAQALAAAGNLYLGLKRYPDAIITLNGALAILPDRPELINSLGIAYQFSGQSEKAEFLFRRAIELSPTYTAPLNNLGALLLESSKLEDAIDAFEKVLSKEPANADVLNNLGTVNFRLGNKEKAIRCFERAITEKSDFTSAYLNLSLIKPWSSDDPLINELQRLLRNESLTKTARADCSLALSNAFFALGDKPQAMKHLIEGNQLRKRCLGYKIESDKALFWQLRSRFGAGANFNAIEPVKPRIPRPLFILGMPRSGTSLLEQMLDGHSRISGQGELPYLSRAIRMSEAQKPGLSSDSLYYIRNYYLKSTAYYDEKSLFATDKTPLNFRWIGYIVNAFPEAKIVHMRRDAAATCWSNYTHTFSTRGLGFSYDMVDVARFYNLYAVLMQYWEGLYPGRIYSLSYESLTQNPEHELASLCDYLELEWESSMLEFSRSERVVHTSSALQIRQALYQGSSQSWREFEDYLSPMLEELER